MARSLRLSFLFSRCDGQVEPLFRRCFATTTTAASTDQLARDGGRPQSLQPSLSGSEKFRRIFQTNRIRVTPLEKLHLAVWSGFGALRDPTQGHLVACLGDVLSHYALTHLHDEMRNDPEGREVLLEKPLIDEQRVPRNWLRSLPDGTVGREYARFMDIHGFHASEREPVHFEEDEELAYVLTRYRQLHDLMHTMFGFGISVEAEVALKAIELVHTRLPVTFFSSVFGPLAVPLLRHGDPPSAIQQTDRSGNVMERLFRDEGSPPMLTPRKLLLQSLLPWAIRVGSRMTKPLQFVYVERWFDRSLEDLRLHCGVREPVPPSLLPYTRISATV